MSPTAKGQSPVAPVAPPVAAQAKVSPTAHLTPAPANRETWPAHVKAARVPPAWTNVMIAQDPSKHIYATGYAANGKKQFILNPETTKANAEDKFARVKELEAKFDQIKAQNIKNQKHADPKVREHADVMALVMEMGVRPGGELGKTQAQFQGYGATTLLGKHVRITKEGTRLCFVPGKKHGEKINLKVDNPAIASMLTKRKLTAGNDGNLFPTVNDKSLLAYTHSLNGGSFKTKDFRTLLASRVATEALKGQAAPTNLAQYKKATKAVATAVSDRLGNTPTVALQSYIPPEVFTEWRESAGV
jgi:DNA topoisomerase-1